MILFANKKYLFLIPIMFFFIVYTAINKFSFYLKDKKLIIKLKSYLNYIFFSYLCSSKIL